MTELLLLSPANIASIEVIRNPSAYYEASVRSVLKVKTTLHAKETSAQVYNHAYYGRYFRDNIGMKLQFANDNAVHYLSYDFSDMKNKQYAITVDAFNIAERMCFDSAEITNNYRNYDHDIIYGGRADFANSHTLYWQYNGTLSKNIGDYQTNEYVSQTASEEMEFNTFKESIFRGGNHRFDLGYEYEVDSAKILHAEIQYSFLPKHSNEDIIGGIISPLIVSNLENSNVFSTKIQYESRHKILDFMFGVRYGGIQSSIDAEYGGYESFTDFSSNRAAAFISFSKDYEKWGWNIGVRAEYLKDKTNEISKEYFNLFPSMDVYVDRIFPWLNADLSFTSRVRRPTLTELSPSYSYCNVLVTSRGNPNLISTITNELTLTLTFFDKFNLSFENDWMKNPIIETGLLDKESGMLLYSPQNIKRSFAFSSYLDYADEWGWFNLSTSLGFSYSNTDVIVSSIRANLGKPAFDASLTMDAVLDKGTIISLGGDYYSDYYDKITHYGSSASVNFGISQDFFNSKFRVSIFINDIFKTLKSDWVERYQDYYSLMKTDYDTRYIRLSLRYNFNNFKKRYKQVDGVYETERVY